MLLAAAAPPPERTVIGQYGRWAALRDSAPARCYAITEPVSGRVRGAALAVAVWPGSRGPSQVHVRFGRELEPGRPIVLAVAGRRYPLVGRGAEAWARDGRDDARIVAAMRWGGSLTIEGETHGARRVRQSYALDGAPSAVDAARIACAPH